MIYESTFSINFEPLHQPTCICLPIEAQVYFPNLAISLKFIFLITIGILEGRVNLVMDKYNIHSFISCQLRTVGCYSNFPIDTQG